MLLMRKMKIRADNLSQENSMVLNNLKQYNLVTVCVYSCSNGLIQDNITRILENSHLRLKGKKVLKKG